MSTAAQKSRLPLLAVDAGMLVAVLLTLAGYLLPWFRKGPSYRWSFSGWAYASLSDGGGWTLLTFGWLLVAGVAALLARRSAAAAFTAMVATVGTLVTVLAVVAASFATLGEPTVLNTTAQLPFGMGTPLMATGLGLMLATSCRAIVRCETRRPDAPGGQPENSLS